MTWTRDIISLGATVICFAAAVVFVIVVSKWGMDK